MRPLLIIAVVSAFYGCPVFAQVGMGTTLLPLGATSPLGSDPGTPVAGTGIPMGPAVSSSPVVSSLPGYPTGAGATACSTLGTAPTAMSGSPSSYDGGGVTLNGTAAPATAATATSGTGAASPMSSGSSATAGLATTSGIAATAGMCGSGSSSVAASSAPTSASSASARAGIPLDSTEINNLGVSSWAAVQGAGAASSATITTTP
jgi:hypothetical protein